MRDDTKPANNANDSTANHPAAAVGSIAPRYSNDDKNCAKDKKHWRDPMFWLLLGTLLASMTAAYFTGQQWRTADDTEKRQLRAYFVLDQANITKFKAGEPIEFHGLIKNTGQTPAYDINAIAAIMYDAFPLPYLFPIISQDSSQEISSVIGSGGIIHTIVHTKQSPTWDTIAAINEGKMAVYVWGNVTYRDAFGASRYTNYRLYFRKPTESAGLLMPLGKDGNEAN